MLPAFPPVIIPVRFSTPPVFILMAAEPKPIAEPVAFPIKLTVPDELIPY